MGHPNLKEKLPKTFSISAPNNPKALRPKPTNPLQEWVKRFFWPPTISRGIFGYGSLENLRNPLFNTRRLKIVDPKNLKKE